MSDGWQTVTMLPRLEVGEVQVWRIDLAEAANLSEIWNGALSKEEIERAERLRAGQVRMQFVVARTCLRHLLSNLLDVPPKDVPITLSPFGKPETSLIPGEPFYFNIAHSRETILIALCRESRVGIDLEYFDRQTDIMEVTRASFTADECRRIEEIADPGLRQLAFFRCWTRKEAIVKADGRGLSLPLNSFEVPISGTAQSVHVEIAGEHIAEARPKSWFVSDVALGQEIAGAFAVETPRLCLKQILFPLAILSTQLVP